MLLVILILVCKLQNAEKTLETIFHMVVYSDLLYIT